MYMFLVSLGVLVMSQFRGVIAALNLPSRLKSFSKTRDSCALAFCAPSAGQFGSPVHWAAAENHILKRKARDRNPDSTVVFMMQGLIELLFNEPLVVEGNSEVYFIVTFF